MSDGSQCLSGAEYRKKEANIKKQAGSLKKNFQQSTVLHESIYASNNVITSHTQNTSASTVIDSGILTSNNVDENPIETDIDFTKTLTTLKDSSNHLISSKSKELKLILGIDPATWPTFFKQ